MPELERIVREARPAWPDPPADLEARILSAAGLSAPPRPGPAWLRHAPRSRRVRLLAVALLLAASGAALAVALVGRSGSGGTGRPASLDFGRPEIVARQDGYIDAAPGLAVDAAGDVTAVWSGAGRVVAATRPHGRRWSQPIRLSDPTRRATRPQVAAGGDGTAVAVWRERTPGRLVSEGFRLPGGAPAGVLDTRVGDRWRLVARVGGDGRWQAPVPVSPSTGSQRYVYAPRVVMTRAGEALVAYLLDGRAWAVARPPRGGWGAPVAISPPGGTPFELDVVVDAPSGFALATWLVRDDDPRLGRRWRIWGAVRAPDGRWGEARPLAGPLSGKPPLSSAINRRGEAVVAWASPATLAATRDASGSWSAPTTLAAAPPFDQYLLAAPAAGIDAEGRALVVTPRSDRASIARRAPGGDWHSSPTSPSGDGAIVADGVGGLVVALADLRSARLRLEALAPGGAPHERARLRGFWTPLVPAVGTDGTTALVRARPRPGGVDLIVAVAPGRGRP